MAWELSPVINILAMEATWERMTLASMAGIKPPKFNPILKTEGNSPFSSAKYSFKWDVTA